jgi:hypothetical protein
MSRIMMSMDQEISIRGKKQKYLKFSSTSPIEEYYGDLSPRKAIDKRIKKLVDVLNNLPDVATSASCGGHKDLKNRLNPLPEGQFYIYFSVETTVNGFLSLGIIDLAARNVNDEDLLVAVFNNTDEPQFVAFKIQGKNWVDPDDVAKEIKFLCETHGSLFTSEDHTPEQG